MSKWCVAPKAFTTASYLEIRGYRLYHFLLTPYHEPQNTLQRDFNIALKHTCVFIEQTIITILWQEDLDAEAVVEGSNDYDHRQNADGDRLNNWDGVIFRDNYAHNLNMV